MKKIIFILSFYLTPSYAYENSPLEFIDFFTASNELVDVVIAGESQSVQVLASVDYDNFKILDPKSIKQLERYLSDEQLNKIAIETIVKTLKDGVRANPGCEGILRYCSPQDVPGKAEYIFDYDNKQLKIFIESEFISTSQGVYDFYEAYKAESALINNTNLYWTADEDIASYNWVNKTLLGLPYGHISLDYQFNNKDFHLKHALYDVEINQYRGILGYQTSTSSYFNATDILNYGISSEGLVATIGNSLNLLKKDANFASKQVLYFASQQGVLEVYQNDSLLFKENVSQGKQAISYSQLPYGVYTLRLIIKKGKATILDENYQIVNTKDFSLGKGEWDYRIDMGLLAEIDSISAMEESNINKSHRKYSKALIAYRPWEAMLIAGGVTATNDTHFIQLGGANYLLGGINLKYNFGIFSDGSKNLYSSLNTNLFTAYTSKVDLVSDDVFLPRALYGDSSLSEWGVSFNHDFLNGSLFLNYSTYKTNDTFGGNKTQNLSINWSRPLFGGSLNLNTSYNISEGDKNNVNTMISWTRQFENNLSMTSSFSFDNKGFSSNQTSIGYSKNSDDSYYSILLNNDLDRDGEIISSLTGSFNSHTDYLEYSAYGYIDTLNGASFSGEFSGAQIITKNKMQLSSKQGDAFVSISPIFLDKEKDNRLKMNFNIVKDDEIWYKSEIEANNTDIIDIPPFTNISYNLDGDMNNISVSHGKHRNFILPGSFFNYKSYVTPLLSQNFLLNDMFNKPIKSARCIGDGCQNLESLSNDGVFRLNYKKGGDFKIISDKRLCVYNPDDIGELYIPAYCLPGLDKVDGGLVWEDRPELIKTADIQRALLYIGKYQSTDDAEQILNTLKTVGLDSKSIEVGSDLYVYVHYKKEYTLAQRNLLENLEAYVILNTIDINQLFTVR